MTLVEKNRKPLGSTLVNSTKTHKQYDPEDLVSLAAHIQTANSSIKSNASNKLVAIAKQMSLLQEQAKRVLEDASRDADLHNAACNMVKKPGHIYYLYERDSGQKYFSCISPEEWGASCPHQLCGAYRLEADLSWTPLEELEQKDSELLMMNKVLNAQLAITDTLT